MAARTSSSRSEVSWASVHHLLQVEIAAGMSAANSGSSAPIDSPAPRGLEDFDHDKNPNVSPGGVADLKSPSWGQQGRPIVLIGDSGTGKTYLLIGVGTAIAEAGRSVRYTITSALVDELAETEAGRRLSSVIARHSNVDLLCLDEF
ncbi:ATP-binding protein [Streptomyces sp. SBC-4]|nr:ATP-binding protein [Streptomyces sp. SBC-4]MDV5143341.1 ATP-binding protein [Streptomyces sp. SBC-4]